MVLILVLGLSLLVGFAAAVALRRSHIALLLALGIGAALVFVLVAYVTAPTDPSQCSDCNEYLGRWWEPWIVGALALIVLLAWWAGVFFARTVSRPQRHVGP
jgi:hypothetical protein